MGPQFELKEIIWEITGRCNNNCEYCGSSDVKNVYIDDKIIRKIAIEIGSYLKDGDINISGGDPLLISFETHKFICDELKNRNNKVKLLINPKSFYQEGKELKEKQIQKYLKIISLYDCVGISVNTKEELEFLSILNLKMENKAIITNFNIKNIWEYDLFESFVENSNVTWQIQFTMDKEEKNVIYNNEIACDFLFNKIQESISKKVKILLADNINCGKCGIGVKSLGILYNGDVVPCLSMRSWKKNLQEEIQGNLITQPLKNIWEDGFKKYRFGQFICCKDICRKPYKKEKLNIDLDKTTPIIDTNLFPPKEWVPRKPFDGHVVMYGINLFNNFFNEE